MTSSGERRGLVLALVGESGAGKTTTTAILEEMGFAPVALSTHLRATAVEKFGTPTRAQVQDLARQTQAEHGDDYYARVALSDPAFGGTGDVVIDGLRNVAELNYAMEAVKNSGRDFFLLAVMASDDLRFSRVVNRGRAGDPIDRQRFNEDDARARGNSENGFQQNGILIDLAESVLHNTGDLNDLHQRIKDAVAVVRRRRAREVQA